MKGLTSLPVYRLNLMWGSFALREPLGFRLGAIVPDINPQEMVTSVSIGLLSETIQDI